MEIGDLVICIEPRHYLIKDALYTITRVSEDRQFVKVDNMPHEFFMRRFRSDEEEMDEEEEPEDKS